uniref:F-box domain-containing protein n=1 Tax=Myotis lucifugus TaxID=59463 RepID=G1Q1U1_MYOLU
MEECACLCGLDSSRGCWCCQKRQGPAETAKAEGKRCPQKRQRPAELAAADGKQCRQEPQGPGSLLDLPVEMLVEIFASLPGKDLPNLAQACTKFHRILHSDSIWRRRCWEEFGLRENLQDMKRFGMSYREVYAKMFPYRNLLGLWQLDSSYRELLKVVVDGLGITGWTYSPSLNTHVDAPMQFEPLFRIRLTERKSARVEYVDNYYSLSHHRHMQIQKDRFSIQWIKRDHQKDSPTGLRGERGLVLLVEDRLQYDCQTYRRLYLPTSHPDHLIRPGLFYVNFTSFGLMIAMLSFHGKYARVTKITGFFFAMLEIHLMHRIHLPDGEFFRNFKELSRVVQEIDKQVTQEQQQQEGRTEESEGHGWQSPAQPSVGESGAAASEEQLVPFVLPVGVRSMDQNYPQTCRMCFYGTFVYSRPCPGVFILFDENHFGFIWLEDKSFILYSRVQNTFQNVEAPSPQAFLEMLSNIQSRPP